MGSESLYKKQPALNYGTGDTLSMLFFSNNLDRIENINLKIFELPIDKCKIDYISVNVFIDPIGVAEDVKILSGSGYKKTDELIRKTILSYGGLWKTFYFEGLTANFTGLIIFHRGFGKVYFNGNNFIDMNTESCKENEYYFNEASKRYQAEDYKGAVKLYKKALSYNSYDADATYNIGISYLKLNKPQEACEWFSKGDFIGDPAAAAAVKKHCD